MSTVEIETGRYIKRFAFWNPATWSIPKLYWDAWSIEQRTHAICRQLEKVIAYADYLGVNVDDIAARLKAIEEGQLDPVIVAAVEAWFEDNQPAIVAAIDALSDALPIAEFNGVNTVKKAIDDLKTYVDESDETLSADILRIIARMASTFDSLEDAIENLDDNNVFVLTLGYYRNSNRGGALYRVTDTAPSGYYETAQNGKYLEIIGADNVAQFGAVGDGATDDTTAIQAAIDNCSRVNFEAGRMYRVSNLIVSNDNMILDGNGCKLVTDNYQTDTLAAALNIGDDYITVSNPTLFNVNQTAMIYNASNTPNYYQIIVTAIEGNKVYFKSYKPFRQANTTADTSPYYFPNGSAVYTGTTIFSVSRQLYVSQSGIVKNVTIENFNFEQSSNLLSTGTWAQLGYGVFSYNAENIRFANNNIKGASSLFVFFYGYHENVQVIDNVFEDVEHAQAVAAHWDMVDISTDNRTHGIIVSGNIFKNCPYAVIFSSVDVGICSDNIIENDEATNRLAIYLYGGDVSMHTSYSSYDQESYYTQNVVVANNRIINNAQGGAGISLQGARNCLVNGNAIKNCNNGVTMTAALNDVISCNVFEYMTTGTNNSSIRIYGKIINLKIKDNIFNSPRMLLISSLLKTVSTGVQSTQYWGYSDSSVFIQGNQVHQDAAFSIIFIGGTTETNTAPTTMMDVPALLMFNDNEVVNTQGSAIVLFDVNSTLRNFITNKTNLTGKQMQAYNNITTGMQAIQGAFANGVTESGNVTMA